MLDQSAVDFTTFALVMAASAALTGLIVAAKRRHQRWTSRDEDLTAVQAAHSAPTPRVGGVAIFAVFACALFVLPIGAEERLGLAFVLSGAPVFAAGLFEDLRIHVSPRGRLMAAAISAGLAIYMFGAWIDGIGLPGFDHALALLPVGIAVTLVWSSGLAHGFNLIDGVNGLSGATAMLIGLGLSGIAMAAGDVQMAAIALVLVAAIAGFLAFNWPAGTIFLGDAGAYALGHVLAWIGILIVHRTPEAAGVSVALLFGWPVADTLLAIFRRRARGMAADQPDRLHFHQLVMRALEMRLGLRHLRHISNPVTTLLLLPLVAGPVLAGALFWTRPVAGFVALVAFGLVFVAAYAACGRIALRRAAPLRAGLVAGPRIAPRRAVAAPVPLASKGEAVSAHSGAYRVGSQSVDVRIYRRPASRDWHVALQPEDGPARLWPSTFDTDDAAFAAFREAQVRGEVGAGVLH